MGSNLVSFYDAMLKYLTLMTYKDCTTASICDYVRCVEIKRFRLSCYNVWIGIFIKNFNSSPTLLIHDYPSKSSMLFKTLTSKES